MNAKNMITALGAALLAGLVATGASAQAWPQKTVRILVPSSAGSAPDQIARLVGDKLSQVLNQPFIIENKPGAGGIINMNQLRQAPADGHTLTIVAGSVAVVTPFLYKEASYQVLRDFEVVGTIAVTPMMFVAHADYPAKTLAQAIAAARAAPDTVALGSSVRGSVPNLANELLQSRTGVKFQIVPFANSGQGMQQVVGGQIPLYTDGVASVIQMVRAGRLNVLAVAADTVHAGLEGFPLAKDTVPGLSVYGWFAMFAPKGTPVDVVARLNKEVNEIINQSDVVAKLSSLGTYPRSGSTDAARQFIRSEIDTVAELIKTTGIVPQ